MNHDNVTVVAGFLKREEGYFTEAGRGALDERLIMQIISKKHNNI